MQSMASIATPAATTMATTPAAAASTEKQPAEEREVLLWLDLEMTGLDSSKDQIIEIACLPTYFDLSPVAPLVEAGPAPDPDAASEMDMIPGIDGMRTYQYAGKSVTPFHRVIAAPKALLDGMSPWCVSTHGASGLTTDCLTSPHSLALVEAELLHHLSTTYGLAPKTVYLAGNSIHQDRIFLTAQMPHFVAWLHYRQVDVSTLKLLVRNLSPQLEHLTRPPPTIEEDGRRVEQQAKHRAVDDMFASIAELARYRALFPSPLPSP